jgi:hypothetical protein
MMGSRDEIETEEYDASRLDELGTEPTPPEPEPKRHDEDFIQFERSFTNIKPEGDQIERIELLRTEYKALLNTICMISDRTPNRTIALRKLEESLMYAVKNIVLEA